MAAVDAYLALRLGEELRHDGEFRLLSRYWTGSLRLQMGPELLVVEMAEGEVVDARWRHDRHNDAVSEVGAVSDDAVSDTAGDTASDTAVGHLGLSAPWPLWEQMLAPVPPPFLNDVAPAQALGLAFTGHRESYFQYYPALRRVIDIIRDLMGEPAI